VLVHYGLLASLDHHRHLRARTHEYRLREEAFIRTSCEMLAWAAFSHPFITTAIYMHTHIRSHTNTHTSIYTLTQSQTHTHTNTKAHTHEDTD
jgi:carbohydrate-binding DOMON domain-containing protein